MDADPPHPHVPPPADPPAPEVAREVPATAPTGPWDPYGAYAYRHPGYHYATPETESREPPFRAVPWWGWVASGAVLFVGLVISALVGQIENYAVAVLQVIPFALTAMFAYVGKRHTWGIVLSFITLALLLVLVYVVTGGMVMMASFAKAGMLTRRERGVFPPGLGEQLGTVIAWSLASWLCALLAALPAVRGWLARRRLPIDPESPVHAASLALVVSLAVISFGQLVATGGRPVLLTLIQSNPDALKATADDLAAGMILGLIFSIPAAGLTVGWPLVRSLPQALERLGVVKPTLKQVLLAIGAAVAMVVVFSGLDWALNQLWAWTGWPKTDAQAFDKLLKPLITPWGAVLVGVTAGIEEELMIRGVLQPRLGIVLPNLFFAGLHAFQYGFDGLISVFCAGLVLGYVRKRTSTTCSAITHGTYDFILVFMSWYFS